MGMSLALNTLNEATDSSVLEEHARQRHSSHAISPIRDSEGSEDDQDSLHELLSNNQILEREGQYIIPRAVERKKWWRIYFLHFAFMWNTRTFEYVSIILVASAFPDDLTATSIRGIASTLSTILFASSVGSWIDKLPDRTRPLYISIMVNHTSIITIYLAWILWPTIIGDDSRSLKNGFFGLIVLLDVVQVLSATGNNLSISRDWIPVLIGAELGSNYTLTHVNAVIARINLLCKVTSPMILPFIISAFSRNTWIFLVTLVTMGVWALEMFCLRIVSMENAKLLAPKSQELRSDHLGEMLATNSIYQVNAWKGVKDLLYHLPAQRLRHFFSMPIWPAAFCMAFLYLTVLVYSAPLITYLLQSGMSLTAITTARASGSLMGFVATFTTPMASGYLNQKWTESQTSKGIVPRKLSSSGIIGQFLSLVPVVLVLQHLSPSSSGIVDENKESVSQASLVTMITLFGFLSLSRFFHWTYELMEQELEQSEVLTSQRSTFSGTGQAICSCFDLLHWFATIAWGRPEEFKGLATASLCLVGSSAIWFWVWAQRL
ncbi:hypothetical protein ONS95_013827 [Cadophora gregata]|uniref:uncharacterized protein n=1 Tax=Cadophora gregata TaxID=51156 RepID=UPI0026DD711E|nr:uncharacterized protein ONS95_013827 [Cadophora gregata]KAK0114335.1 hypothetical protein ONS95_013827 [Cadophora gregata]